MTRAAIPPIDIRPLQAHLAALEGLDRLAGAASSFTEWNDELIGAILDQAASFAADRIEQVNIAGETDTPRIDHGTVRMGHAHRTVWQEFAAAGWMTLDLATEHGGQGLPLVLAVSVQEIFDRHCPAFGMLPVPIRSAARLIGAFATKTLRDEWLARIVSGDWGATICISEASAGSDLGRIRTRATRREDGTWSITGEKQWISFGSHDLTARIGHCLLARTDNERGLSLFLVPDRIGEQANGVHLRRLEHKLGLHSSPTCAIGFEDATGHLLGEEGRGLPQMFVMITNMRMAVGAMGLGMAGAAADIARNFAGERLQGGSGTVQSPIIEHPDVLRMVVSMEAEVEVSRGLLYAAAVESDLGRLDPDLDRRRDSAALAQWLLPIIKTLGGDLAFSNASTAMQVLGGAGYTSEWPIEQILRDSRVLPIFEGTTGMQALDILHRRLWKEDGHGLSVFIRRFETVLASYDAQDSQTVGKDALTVLALLRDTARQFKELKDRPKDAEAGATAFLALAIDAALAWTAARLTQLPSDDPVHRRIKGLARYALPGLASQARLHAALALGQAGRLNALRMSLD